MQKKYKIWGNFYFTLTWCRLWAYSEDGYITHYRDSDIYPRKKTKMIFDSISLILSLMGNLKIKNGLKTNQIL